MGYQVKLYAVIEHTEENTTPDNKCWGEVVGMVDIGKCYLDVDWDRPLAYIFADDGNTRIEKDRYGAELGAKEIDYVIEALDSIIEHEDYGYIRAKVAADFLCSLRDNIYSGPGHWLTIYCFGY